MPDEDLIPDRSEASEPDLWVPGGACLELLRDQSILIPVLGAGVSVSNGIPGGADLAQRLAENFKPHPSIGEFDPSPDPRLVADQIICDYDDICLEVQTHVAGFFDDAVADCTPNSIINDLVNVPSKLIITMNYDGLLEKAAAAQGIDVEVLDDLYGFRSFNHMALAPQPPEKLTILHIHGGTNDPRTLVLDSMTYRSISGNPDLRELFRNLVRTKRLCYLGTRLDEPQMQNFILDATDRSEQVHPIFTTSSGALDLRSRSMEGRRFALKICALPSHAHLAGLARYLRRSGDGPGERESATDVPSHPPPRQKRSTADAGATNETTTGELSDVGNEQGDVGALADDDYVPTRIVAYDDDRDDRTLDFLEFLADGGRYGSATEGVFDEQSIVEGRRDLVIGVPGSGKTELLRHVAGMVPNDRVAVAVRLVDLPANVADPRTQLARWAQHGTRANGESRSIENSTVHFFLDGFDEIAPNLQEHFAQQIVRLANAHPQHSFTVASRPVEATSLFPPDLWRRLKLAPGSSWQERFLSVRGVSLGDVLEGLEGSKALGELLQLPFFLSTVVDLYQRDGLKGQNVWSVVKSLVDQALARETDRLPVALDAARAWLRRVALSMLFSGRTFLRFDDLDAVSLEGITSEDRRAICEELVQRAMLRKTDGGYVFVHRIIGESLAAEGLDSLAPSKELLDAIAPSQDEHLRGVLPEWQVPLTFLLPQSEAWRDAVKVRDPLHWARSVPDDADLGDRIEAAELIWGTYCQWKIWIWDYAVPDLLQDGPALARHLRAGDQDDLIDQIREAIDDSSPQVQGNAIRALGMVGDIDISGELRRVLADDSREAVVRRQAAIVAADLEQVDLLPIILDRAVDPYDSAEAQDCAAAVLDLAGPDQIEEIAQDLVAGGDTRSLVLSRLSRLLEPSAQLRLLRRLARLDPDPMRIEKRLLLEAIATVDNLTQDDIHSAVYVSVLWGMSDTEITDLVTLNRETSLTALKEALEAMEEPWWWHGRFVASEFDADELEAAGISGRVVNRRRIEEEEERRQREGQSTETTPTPAVQEPENVPPTLSELLGMDPTGADAAIQYSAHELSGQVTDLSDDEKRDLSDRLSTWWQETPFYNAITFEGSECPTSRWTIQGWASAWLWFGPALNKRVEPEQWAEIAMSGVLFEQQFEWLQAFSTEAAQAILADTCTSDSARVWAGALSAIEGAVAPLVVNALVEGLSGSENIGYESKHVVNRLANQGELEALQTLSGSSEELASLIRPYLARLGDEASIAGELAKLHEELGAGLRPTRDDLFWLEGLQRSAYLADLFEAVVLIYTTTAVGRPEFVDTMTPLLDQIQVIGGVEAVERYDEVLSNTDDPALLFLRRRRDNVAEAELSRIGETAAPIAARAAGVPLLTDEGPLEQTDR